MKFRIVAVMYVAAALFLSGCTASILDNTFNEKTVNLKEISYGASDMLIQQASARINSDTPLEISSFTDIDSPAEITSFGRVVSGQVAARFVQLGYNVSASTIDDMMLIKQQQQQASSLPIGLSPSGMAPSGMSPATQARAQPIDTAMILGQYVRAKKYVLVNLRIVEKSTGRILAAYDFNIPYNSDIKALTRTESDEQTVFGF